MEPARFIHRSPSIAAPAAPHDTLALQENVLEHGGAPPASFDPELESSARHETAEAGQLKIQGDQTFAH